MLQALLEKLEPENMMQPNGTRAAEIALGLLEKQASEQGIAKQLEAPGVKILIQTSVLHPIPALRRAACATLAACTAEGHAEFLSIALAQQLPVAFLRLLHEEDQRAAKAGRPDVPARRAAVVGLTALLGCDGMAEKVLGADPKVASAILKACGSSDADVRLGSLQLALSLTRDEKLSAFVQVAAELEPPATADMLLRVGCGEREAEGTEMAAEESDASAAAADEASGSAVGGRSRVAPHACVPRWAVTGKGRTRTPLLRAQTPSARPPFCPPRCGRAAGAGHARLLSATRGHA